MLEKAAAEPKAEMQERGLLMAANHFRRIRLGQALFAWSYSFERLSPVLEFQSFGLEIGMTLSGARCFESRHRGEERYERGQISVFNLGEQYSTHYEPDPLGAGREVGLLIRGDHPAASGDHIVGFPRRLEALTDQNMLSLGSAIAHALDLGDDLQGSVDTIEAEVRSFIERYGDLVRVDALERARLELMRHFAKPLYMRHFAEIAGVHEETFARKFSARYGVTPARYRMLVRLKEAALLLATRPDLSVREVAKTAGFEDPAYFHRAFASHFKTTPLQFGREFSDSIAA